MKDSNASAKNGFPVAARRIKETEPRPQSRSRPDRLTGEPQPQVQRQLAIESPVVLPEGRELGVLGRRRRRTCKVNLLRQRPVLPLEQHRPRGAVPVIGAVNEAAAERYLMLTEPMLPGKAKALDRFFLVRGSGPGVEEVATPAVGRYEHVLRSLAVGITGKAGVFHQRGQDAARGRHVAVRDPYGVTALSVV